MSDPRCAKCGHPRSNHPYRHMFVGPFGGPNESGRVMTDFETHPVGTAKRIEELEAKLAVAHATGKLDGIQEAAIVARQALIDGAYIKRGSHQEKPSSVMFLAETLVSNAIGSLIPTLAELKCGAHGED